MPKFQVYVLDDPYGTEGNFQEWDLPWERLVFDQRLDYAPDGGESAVFKVVRVLDRVDGSYVEVVRDPGNQVGGDPKKTRPPYRD